MRSRIALTFVMLLLVTLMGAAAVCLSPPHEDGFDAPPEEITASYRIQAEKLDLLAVNSYPQRIERAMSVSEPHYDLEIQVVIDPNRLVSLPLAAYDYPEDVRPYLEPSVMIESDSPLIAALAAEIIGAETDIAAMAARSAAWTAENIAYDERLARQIWNGLVDSQSAVATLEERQGTCSEYTNLFIAIMRSQAIPARFVTGVVYEGGYHAWPEFYLYGVGWIPVEAQGGFVGTTSRHIKLFVGRDFADIGVKLRDIRVDIQPLTEELDK
jgi:transglutaminase-like putative cysteine protease